MDSIDIEVVTTQEVVAIDAFAAGTQGPQGIQGIPGVGVPAGGAVNQLLQKASTTDYDVEFTSSPTVDGLALNQSPTDPGGIGIIRWNDTIHTPEVGLNNDVTLQIGQEQVIYVRNTTGVTITNGTLVYVDGATGTTPEIVKASASAWEQAFKTIAMATQDISNNGFGFVTTFGIVRDLDTSTFSEGSSIYLSETAGLFTATPPIYPSNRLLVGVCTYSHAVNGSIFFFPKLIHRKFGDPDAGDYTGFDDEGHLRCYGDARPWRDELGDALSLRVVGTGIAVDPVEGVVNFQTSANLSDYIYKNQQLNHDRDHGSIIYPHVHVRQTNAGIPNLLLQYRWVTYVEAYPTTWINLRCNIPTQTYSSGVISQIYHTAAGITPPANSGLSDIVQFRILRDNANASAVFTGADTYTGDLGVLSFDTHIQLNSVGSTEQYVK